jgi:hypothetical protein
MARSIPPGVVMAAASELSRTLAQPTMRQRVVANFAPAPGALLGSARSQGRATAPTDSLFDVLMTQRADGSFARSPVLLAWLGGERIARLKAAVTRTACDEAIAFTATVLHLLQREHGDREDEWKPAAAKARAWLAKQPTQFDASAH